MMEESLLVILCEPLDIASHNIHLQVSVEVIVSNVPGCIDQVPECFVKGIFVIPSQYDCK